jgi:glycosyltransferase involved in cell wall biosynthesis
MPTLRETGSGQQTREVVAKVDAPVSPALSIVMPVFNEAGTIEQVIDNVHRSVIRHELIVVDDGSSDGTAELLQHFVGTVGVRILRRGRNRGKGAALKLAFAEACGEVVIVQDADLEYDPAEYSALIQPILSGEADVVYGSRFLTGSDVSISRTTWWANKVITAFFNRVLGQQLTDVETCYKAFRRTTLEQVAPLLMEDRFGIEIELAARLARLPGVRIAERPIRYRARSRREGKKIRWTDGVRALWCILRYRRSFGSIRACTVSKRAPARRRLDDDHP